MTDEEIRNVQSRTKVYTDNVYVIYAWDERGDGIKADGHYTDPQSASTAAFQAAIDFPTHKVCVYAIKAVISPDPNAPGALVVGVPGVIK